MSTRKLILTALAAGLAILIAGAAMLIRLSGDNSASVEVLDLGSAATVGALTITPRSVGDRIFVATIAADGAAKEPLAVGGRFRLRTGGAAAVTVEPGVTGVSTCSEVATVAPGSSVECSVAFEAGGQGTPYLWFESDGASAVWQAGK